MAWDLDGRHIGLYTIWRRDDGVAREVTATSWTMRGRRTYEHVFTETPLPLHGPDRWSWHGGPTRREKVPLKRFLATHTRIEGEEARLARGGVFQMELPLTWPASR